MPTLNQTIEIFEQFSYKHKAIGKNLSRSNFYFGDEWEIGGKEYPLVWLSKLPTTYDKSGMVIHKFQVDISDKVNNDESNETNVLSDTEQLCFNCIDYIEQIAQEADFTINIGSVSEITDYTEKRDDKVSGNYFTIEIKSHNLNNSCVLPIFDGTIFKANYIYLNGSIVNTSEMPITTETFTNQTGSNIPLSQTVSKMVGVFNGSGQFITPGEFYDLVNNEIEFIGDPFESTTIIVVYQTQS